MPPNGPARNCGSDRSSDGVRSPGSVRASAAPIGVEIAALPKMSSGSHFDADKRLSVPS